MRFDSSRRVLGHASTRVISRACAMAVAVVFALSFALAPPDARASALFDGSNSDIWLVDPDTGRLTGIDLGPEWRSVFSGPGGPIHPLQPGEAALINALANSSVAMTPGQPAVSLVGLGDPYDDGGAGGQTLLDVSPASGDYDGTVSVQLRVSKAQLATPGHELTYTLTGDPGPVALQLGPAQLNAPGALVQGGFLAAHTLHLVRDGTYTLSATLKAPGGATLASTARTYTIASTHPDGFRRDSDGDGVPDLVEAQMGLDPLSDDWTRDSDGDGWSNFDEWLRLYCLDASRVPDPSAGFACLDGDGNPLDTDADRWSDFDEQLRRTRHDDPSPFLVPGVGETVASETFLERIRSFKDHPQARRLYEVERRVAPGQALPDTGPAASLSVDQQNAQAVDGSYGGGVVQSFTPAADNLAGVDVMLAGGDTAFDDLTLLVWPDPIRSTRPIVRARLLDVPTAEGEVASFRFPAVGVTPGATYYIEILAKEALIAAAPTPGAYAGGAVVEASGLQSGDHLFGGQVDLWFRTYGDAAFDGVAGGRPAGTSWSRVKAASAMGEPFYDSDALLFPGEISGAGLTFADVADRKEIAVASAALDAAEWPGMRLPAGDGTVVAARLQVAEDTTSAAASIYKGWLDALADATPRRLLDEVGAGTWNTPAEWRVAFVAWLDAQLTRDVTLDIDASATVDVSLLEAVLAEEARLRGGTASVLFAHEVDRDLVISSEEALQRIGGETLRFDDVVAELAGAAGAAGPLADLGDVARIGLRDPAPGTRSDAAFIRRLQQGYDPGCYVSLDALADLQTDHRAMSAFAAECPDWVTEADRAALDAAAADARHRLRTLWLPGAAVEVAGDATLLDEAVDSDGDGAANGLEVGRVLPRVTLPWLGDTDGDSIADGDDLCPIDAFDRCSSMPRLPDALAGADIVVNEPEAGSGVAIISVGLERTYDAPVTIDYRAVVRSGDTATAGVDFDDTPGQVTIRPGERVVLIMVRVFQDGQEESRETFHIELVSADNADVVGDGAVQVAIDDTAGSVTGPTAVLVADAIVVDERAPTLLSASPSTDPVGETLTFSWVQLDTGVPFVTLSGADMAVVSFDAPAVLMNTQLQFEVTVTNQSGLSDTAIATVDVLAYNDPPLIIGTPQFQVAADDSLVITDAELLAHATDPENDVLTVGAVTVQPEFGTLQDTGSGFVYTPGPPPSGLQVDVDNFRSPNGGYATPLMQSFIPHQDNLAGVDVCAYTPGASPVDITIKVWTNPARIGTPLVDEEKLSVPKVAVCTWVEFRFDPVAWPANVPLYLEVISTNFAGVSILASAGSPGHYLEGAVVERAGGTLPASGADLLFRTWSDPAFSAGSGVDVALLSQPELAPQEWIVNGTRDTVLLHEIGTALDAPGTVRLMAVDLATKARTLVLETAPYDFRTTEGHPAVWFRTDDGAMIHRYDPTATPKLVSIATPRRLQPDIVYSLADTAVDPRTGDLHYCERDVDANENDKYFRRLSHADGSVAGPGVRCQRFDDLEQSLKLGRRSCIVSSQGALYCTELDGIEMMGVGGFPAAFSGGPPPEGGTRLLGVEQVGDKALVFVVALGQFSTPTALQVRLLQEELPPEEEEPTGPPFPEPPDPALYFPLLLELADVLVQELPEVVVTPKGAIIAIGEQPSLSGGSDQVHLYQWAGGNTEGSMTNLLGSWVMPTSYGVAGKLGWIGGKALWQLQDVFEDPDKRKIWQIVDPPGSFPPVQLFATVDGLPGDDAPLDLLDFGSGYLGVLLDPSQAGTNTACNLAMFGPDATPIPFEDFVRCSSHQSLEGRGSVFELMDGAPNLMFLGIDVSGLGQTMFSVEIEDTGGLKATLPVEIEVVAP